jgi:very-short-patch-repair endonuclease
MKAKLLHIFKDKKLNPNTINQVLKKEPEIKSWLSDILAKNQNYESIGKLVICLIKDITLAKCEICGKELTYSKTISNSKHKFCSNKCKLSKAANPFSQSEVKEKIKQTILDKYGVDNIAKSDYFKSKPNSFSRSEVKEKIKQTILDKYGVKHNSQNAEIKAKMVNRKLVTTYAKIVEKYKGLIEPNFSVDEYIGTGKIYSWKCTKCGNIFEAVYDDGEIHSRCFNCFPKKRIVCSKKEKELVEFLKQYFPDLVENDRTLIKPKELDIVIPSKKIAIEFNGSYWHSEQAGKDKHYHLNKTLLVEQAGYRLIHIYEHDWIKNKEVVKRLLLNILNIEQEVIDSQLCEVKEISTKLKNEFLKNNHIIGRDKSDIKLGLFNFKKLVAVMTFKKLTENKCELSRYASSKHIINGISELLKYFECKYLPKSIITYVDRNYFSDQPFNELNFKFLYLSEPNFKLFEGNKIFDCGNLVFEKIYE